MHGRKRGDHDHRHAEAVGVEGTPRTGRLVDSGDMLAGRVYAGVDVVEPAAPIIPGDENSDRVVGIVVPVSFAVGSAGGVVAHRVDDGSYIVRSRAIVLFRMV